MNRQTFNAVFNEPIWTTFDGVTKKVSEIDHQHLSNIIHFMRFVNPNYPKHIKEMFKDEIDRRFDGTLLYWRPLRRFAGEMKYLQRMGWLHKNENKHGKPTDVIINNQWVGEVNESEC